MEAYLRELCADSNLIVIRNITNKFRIDENISYSFRLSPLGKTSFMIPYLNCPASEDEKRIKEEKKEAIEKLLYEMDKIGYEYRDDGLNKLISEESDYMIVAKKKDMSFQIAYEYSINQLLIRRQLTPTDIRIKRGFSYLEILITTKETISRVKSIHIYDEIQQSLFCKAIMYRIEDNAIKILAREPEEVHVKYKELYEALEWIDNSKLLIGIDLDYNPIFIDMKKTNNLLWFHGEKQIKNSIVDYIRDKNYTHFVYGVPIDSKGPFCIMNLLEYEPHPGETIIVTATSDVYGYHMPELNRTYLRLMKRDDITFIFETVTTAALGNGMEDPMDIFDYEIVMGQDQSQKARHHADINNRYTKHFYHYSDAMIKVPTNKHIRVELLT